MAGLEFLEETRTVRGAATVSAAVERATEALGADVGAIVEGETIVQCIGVQSDGEVRAALTAALGGSWALRAPVLLEDDPALRGRVHATLVALAEGEDAPGAADVVRRALVETLRHGDRLALARALDGVLLGRSAAPALERLAV